jgi:hypothetical protein
MIKKMSIGFIALSVLIPGHTMASKASVSHGMKASVSDVCELTPADITESTPTLIPLKEFKVKNNDPKGFRFSVEHQDGKSSHYTLVIIKTNKGVSETKRIALSTPQCFEEAILEDGAVNDLSYRLYLEPKKTTSSTRKCAPTSDEFRIRLEDSALSRSEIVQVRS